VRDGFARILDNVARFDPRAERRGVLVQEMAAQGNRHELILGMTQDPAYGPAIAVGLGGIFVETLRDVALEIPPLRARDARDMLSRLRAAPILEGQGGRGQGPADLAAIVDVLGRFSRVWPDPRDLRAGI